MTFSSLGTKVLAYDARFRPEGKDCDTCPLSRVDNNLDCGYHFNRLEADKQEKAQEKPEISETEPVKPASVLEGFVEMLFSGKVSPEISESVQKVSNIGKDQENKTLVKILDMIASPNKKEFWEAEITSVLENVLPMLKSACNVGSAFGVHSVVTFEMREAAFHLEKALKILQKKN